MSFKQFIKPTKGKIILTIVIAVLALLSIGFESKCMPGKACDFSTFDTVMNYASKIISPGINNLLGDNGFFMNYKPSGNFGMVLEGIFHFGLDIVYWYLLSCVIIWLFNGGKK
jgi:hypothetical protein